MFSSLRRMPARAFSSRVPRLSDIGTANLNWGRLFFDYVPTNAHIEYKYSDGQWNSGRVVKEPFLTVHILGNVFHYGQAIFEGLKVFQHQDERVRVFRDNLNAQRMQHGCKRLVMPEIPEEMLLEAVDRVVQENIKFLPPYGSNGALYVRPFLFGSGPKLGLGPSSEYTFVVFANPVGAYYAAGQLQALDCVVVNNYDRAAPKGVGSIKCAGNYAADIKSIIEYKEQGFPIGLYLDAKEGRYVEEFNTSNFIAITKDGKYITPPAGDGTSVLNSVTNRSLEVLAADLGLKVERRRIDLAAEIDTFKEVAAVGTAVITTPIRSIQWGDKKYDFGDNYETIQKLYDLLRSIQVGDEPDKHGWCREVGGIELEGEGSLSMRSIYPPL